jgi:hypothetical protein
MIEFKSDKVRIKTGKADNSAIVEFEIGEYQLENIKELVNVIDKELTVSVKIE